MHYTRRLRKYAGNRVAVFAALWFLAHQQQLFHFNPVIQPEIGSDSAHFPKDRELFFYYIATIRLNTTRKDFRIWKFKTGKFFGFSDFCQRNYQDVNTELLMQ